MTRTLSCLFSGTVALIFFGLLPQLAAQEEGNAVARFRGAMEEFRQAKKQLNEKLVAAEKDGNQDVMRELKAKSEAIEKKMHDTETAMLAWREKNQKVQAEKRERKEPGPDAANQDRTQHLRQAAQHLRAAGFEDLAEQVVKRARSESAGKDAKRSSSGDSTVQKTTAELDAVRQRQKAIADKLEHMASQERDRAEQARAEADNAVARERERAKVFEEQARAMATQQRERAEQARSEAELRMAEAKRRLTDKVSEERREVERVVEKVRENSGANEQLAGAVKEIGTAVRQLKQEIEALKQELKEIRDRRE